MKTTLEPISPTKIKLIIDADFDDFKSEMDAAYKAIAGQVNLQGFRPGKVPPAVIDARIGRGVVLEQAVNDALPKLLSDAIRENNVKQVGQPEVDITELNDRKNVVFSAEMEVRPEFTLPDIDGVKASVETVSVTDEDLSRQEDLLRRRFGTLLDVERPAADGDQVTINLVATKDGQAIEGAQVEAFTYDVGSGQMLDGLDETLVGMSAGESKTFTSQLRAGEYADTDVDVEVTVTDVKEHELPDFDDGFAQMASEFDTADELRADLRERIERRERLEQASQARDVVLDTVLSSVDIEVPEKLLSDEIHAREHELNDQVTQAGIGMDDFLRSEGLDADAHAERVKADSERAIQAQFLLDLIVEEQNFSVEQSELTDHIVRRAQQAGVRPDEYAQHAMQNELLPMLMAEVVRGKALAYLVERAEVTDGDGNHVELKTLLPDGSYADQNAEGDDTVGSAAEPSDGAEGTDDGDAEDR